MNVSKELKIGLFVILVLIGTFAVINLLRGTDLLGREVEIRGHFDNAQSLVASAPVQIRGYSAGRVEEVSYDTQRNDFLVVCSVSKEFAIPVDSRMVIYSTNIMGGKGVRIDIGSSTDMLVDGGELATDCETDLISSLSEGISPVMAKVTILLDSLETTVESFNQVLDNENKANLKAAVSHLNKTLSSAEQLAGSIKGKFPEINEVIDNLAALSDKFAPLAASLQTSIDNAGEITDQIKSADLKGSIDEIQKAVASVKETVDKVKDPLNSLLNDADTLVKKVTDKPGKYIKFTLF